MRDLRNSHISGALDVVATLRDRQIEARVTELARDDDLTIALRQSLRNGVDINDLSDASGLPVDQIRKRVERELYLGEDLATLAGVR